MKRKGQTGQGLLLALILLAIGALVVVPALTLTTTSLKNSQLIGGRARSLYAVDAAQEFVMWKLLIPGYISTFTYDGQSDNFTVDVCGQPVKVSVVMRAIATWRGVTLIANTPIKPTKTVSTTNNITFTYTISLEQISSDTSEGLDAVYDVLPSYTSASSGGPNYDYISGSSQLSSDGGTTWTSINDPAVVKSGSNIRLQWPATYDYSTGTGGFTSPTSNFTGAQIKQIKFKVMPSSLGSNVTYYNWLVLKPWNTVAGPIAPLVTGTGANPKDGLLMVTKSTNTVFIPPGQSTTITYTITITNLQGNTNQIQTITDYLPPGFNYVGQTTGLPAGKYTFNTYNGTVNGVYRTAANWTFSPAWSIGGNPPGNVQSFTFKASTSENVSGSYYNEIMVVPATKAGTLFSSIGIGDTQFSSGYSWNSAPVIVPAYDSSTTTGNVTVTTVANLGVTIGGASIYSYQIK